MIEHEQHPDLEKEMVRIYVLNQSFKKCVCRVNRKEFEKIAAIPGI